MPFLCDYTDVVEEISAPAGCAFIKLTNGNVALVDADDADALSAFSWHEVNGYAVRYEAKRKAVLMHRQILNVPSGQSVDHANRVRLDNRRCNLRLATHAENMRNIGPRKNNRTGYKGVVREIINGSEQYRARIRKGDKCVVLGYFSDAKTAAQAYDNAARALHGEFACTNF